jgi:hypothetical protein
LFHLLPSLHSNQKYRAGLFSDETIDKRERVIRRRVKKVKEKSREIGAQFLEHIPTN